jgi:hypothetical protein
MLAKEFAQTVQDATKELQEKDEQEKQEATLDQVRAVSRYSR